MILHSMATPQQALDDKIHWYKDAIIYELHIKAFADSNGDGIGDFHGLMEKLDYLQELGVTAIWVLPFYPSPLRDDGYDIADYYSINPSYGSIEDFQRFLDEAHKRNLKVITELVINHTSDQHPWFQRARLAPKGSEERNFYVWTDDPNQYKGVRIIFQDFEASNWTWDPVAQQYYWHRFFHHQPDLNYDSLAVQEEVMKVLDYWCDMGVDGFRLDAVPYLFEREGTNGENLPETHAFLKKLRKHIDDHHPGTVFLAEANMWPEDSASYFGDGDECHMNYHFPVMPRMFMSVQMEDRFPITDIFAQTPEIPDTCQWAMFLRNHDELTLEMVTDEERDYMYKAYAKDPKARINLGIRHRLAPLMDNNRRKIELMNSLLFSLPGTPVVYYGDEIGMGDNFYLGDRDGVRTPMQWNSDRNAGFSKANPQRLYLPVILDPEYNYEAVNVELQRSNTSSLFWFMKQIISVRKKYKVFGRGDMKFLHVDNPKVLAFTRTYKEETLLVVVNLSKFSQPASIDLNAYAGYTPTDIFSKSAFPAISGEANYFFTLSAHSFQWFILGKTHTNLPQNEVLATLEVNELQGLLDKSGKRWLEENILPGYLRKTRWFYSRHLRIQNLSIINTFTIPLTNPVGILVVEVTFEKGLPETYILPLVLIKGAEARSVISSHPEAVIAKTSESDNGILCDAYYTSELQQYFIRQLIKGENIRKEAGELHFASTEALAESASRETELKPLLHFGDDLITAVTYNNKYFLRLYRKVDKGMHPDLELARYLSAEKNFKCTPPYLGHIEWKVDKDGYILGMLQVMIENHGHGEGYMYERINNFIERILARDRSKLNPYESFGSLQEPVTYEELPEHLQVLFGSNAADFAESLGKTLGQMHLQLASGTTKDLQPEEFSLHYQRSLYSGMVSHVREVFDYLGKQKQKLPHTTEAEDLLKRKEDLLKLLKRVYNKKLDIIKIRIHGNLKLRKIMLTGKGVVIHDFSGNPNRRSFSERRLKRSPLRDVAAIIRSFYYVAYEGFFSSSQVQNEERDALMPFAEMWAWYMSSFFARAYMDVVQNSAAIIPGDKKDFAMMMETYLIDKALQDLQQELDRRPDFAIVPIKLIKGIVEKPK